MSTPSRDPSKPKNAVSDPPRQLFTQGVIFSGGVAAGYEPCETFGIVITARCDAANDKVHLYNYLPIVKLDDWMHRDGKHILAERIMADALGGLRAILNDASYNPVILETEEPKQVVESLFPQAASDKATVGFRKRAAAQLQRLDLAQRVFESLPEDCLCLEVTKQHPRNVAGLINELAHHKLTGYYFLDRVETNGDDDGYVVQLREIQAIPRKLAQLVAVGLDGVALSDLCKISPDFSGKLQVGTKDIAMPVGMLGSPNVEHLLQSLALLFGRIGISDPNPNYVNSLLGRQPSLKEAV